MSIGKCFCGCGMTTSLITENDAGRGLVKGERRRYVAGHQGRLSPLEYIENANGCWIWQRGKTSAGYGMTNVNGSRVYAHRALYEKYRGQIPKGMVIDHLCGITSCVNPDHLEPVFQHINSWRGRKSVLTKEQVLEIRRQVSTGRTSAKIADDFGISASYISSIVTGKRWADVEGSLPKTPVRFRRKAKIQKSDYLAIVAMKNSGSGNKEIAIKYGISETYACQISTGYLDKRYGN